MQEIADTSNIQEVEETGVIMTEHVLKTWMTQFQDIVDCRKTFEVRKNDRDFKVGDTLLLCEWNPLIEMFTGRQCKVEVRYCGSIPGYPDAIGMSISRPLCRG